MDKFYFTFEKGDGEYIVWDMVSVANEIDHESGFKSSIDIPDDIIDMMNKLNIDELGTGVFEVEPDSDEMDDLKIFIDENPNWVLC
jgi:hypothetical protein